jgi:hypothetical protein
VTLITRFRPARRESCKARNLQAESGVEGAHNLMLVGFEGAARGRVRDGLAPLSDRVTAAGNGSAALRLASRGRFDALFVAHPLGGAAMAGFLGAVRNPESPCRTSGLVLVAPERLRREAEAYLGRGANRVIALEQVPDAIAGVLQPLLRIPRRSPWRVPVRLQVLGRGLIRRLLCESVNLSMHGALLRVPHTLSPGTELRLELFLPGRSEPARGEARVVRQTSHGREPYPGIGVEFTALDDAACEALHARTGGPAPSATA